MLTFGFTAAMTAAYNAAKGLMAGAGTVARQVGPAAAVHPEIIGTPHVGEELACTTGD